MNAYQFIQKHGVDKAREVVNGAPDGVMLFEYIPICSGFSYIKIIDGIRYCFNPATNNWFIDNFKAEISFQFNDIKRLVDSVAIVESLGGIDQAKLYISLNDNQHSIMLIYRMITSDEIKQAIADYESIYSNDCEILDYPEDYTSPNCKKFNERVK